MRLSSLFFPTRCAFCRKVCEEGLCPRCERLLPRAGKTVQEGAGYGRCSAPLRYEGIARDAILRYKFSGGLAAADGFARLMAESAAEAFPDGFDTVTWVPVSRKRRRKRGFDQSELLAKNMARLWETKAVRLLEKTSDNPAQSALASAAERRGNVLGRYEAADRERIRGARIQLVDDILTTGATLGECVRVLKAAGAESVVCAVLAVTPEKA